MIKKREGKKQMERINGSERLIISQSFFYRYQGSNMSQAIFPSKRLRDFYDSIPQEMLPKWIENRINEQWHLVRFFANV